MQLRSARPQVAAPSLMKLSTEGRNKFAVRLISGVDVSLPFARKRKPQPISVPIPALDYSEDNISCPKTLLMIAKEVERKYCSGWGPAASV